MTLFLVSELLIYRDICLIRSLFDNWLVVWNMTFIFPNSWDDDLQSDFHIFQRG